MIGRAEVLERVRGRSGELVLRRSAAGLEIVANGVFLVSAANAVSSRALVTAALPFVRGEGLRMLIGGLGLGDALDEALACERFVEVVVAELEPAVVRWFHEHGGAMAERGAAGERAGRARIEVMDVVEALGCGQTWDIVALDTDNGPDWLVREANVGLYSERGIEQARGAVRLGGAVVYWSPEVSPAFEARLRRAFARVERVGARDVIDGRPCDYTMYVALCAADATGDTASSAT